MQRGLSDVVHAPLIALLSHACVKKCRCVWTPKKVHGGIILTTWFNNAVCRRQHRKSFMLVFDWATRLLKSCTILGKLILELVLGPFGLVEYCFDKFVLLLIPLSPIPLWSSEGPNWDWVGIRNPEDEGRWSVSVNVDITVMWLLLADSVPEVLSDGMILFKLIVVVLVVWLLLLLLLLLLLDGKEADVWALSAGIAAANVANEGGTTEEEEEEGAHDVDGAEVGRVPTLRNNWSSCAFEVFPTGTTVGQLALFVSAQSAVVLSRCENVEARLFKSAPRLGLVPVFRTGKPVTPCSNVVGCNEAKEIGRTPVGSNSNLGNRHACESSSLAEASLASGKLIWPVAVVFVIDPEAATAAAAAAAMFKDKRSANSEGWAVFKVERWSWFAPGRIVGRTLPCGAGATVGGLDKAIVLVQLFELVEVAIRGCLKKHTCDGLENE